MYNATTPSNLTHYEKKLCVCETLFGTVRASGLLSGLEYIYSLVH